MGFDEEDYQNLINYGLNNEQIRKLAGNSIVVNVLENIFIALNNYIKKIDWK